MAVRTVTFVIKKFFTTNVIEVQIDPCTNLREIYRQLFSAAKTQHYPDALDDTIEFVFSGVDSGQPEHGPHFNFNSDICFKNTNQWRGYEETYSLYSRIYNTQCSICYSDIVSRSTPFSCPHAYCTQCINPWMERSSTCPTCRTGVSTHNTFRPSTIQNLQSGYLAEYQRIHNYITNSNNPNINSRLYLNYISNSINEANYINDLINFPSPITNSINETNYINDLNNFPSPITNST